jgi:hypothetical protein
MFHQASHDAMRRQRRGHRRCQSPAGGEQPQSQAVSAREVDDRCAGSGTAACPQIDKLSISAHLAEMDLQIGAQRVIPRDAERAG